MSVSELIDLTAGTSTSLTDVPAPQTKGNAITHSNARAFNPATFPIVLPRGEATMSPLPWTATISKISFLKRLIPLDEPGA